ncbi:AMP-binding protein [Aequorivita sp. CIP111184]|uniref:AMP-binding protein n=1 Tax=Aequorivita sp. CIP111184 TaxID=2211356 RepID=UPI000DBC3170|nr:AMP-binding protein [Aequorivita sp. CIP111184]SRX54827.1 Acetyl-coenzyme A synthetase [Aequorivita sp. CIP111184]
MNTIEIYRRVAQAIAEQDFDILDQLKPIKPTYFNWVTDIFEPLNVQQHPNDLALIWKYNDQQQTYTFAEIAARSNQFLNFIRRHDVQHGDNIFIQLPLVPPNWYSYLACIKGGMIIIPAATSLDVRDLEFRFQSVFPQVALADQANAEKIDTAEKATGKKIKVKIITEGTREGWEPIDNILSESTEAEGAKTQSDDDLFYFFTSGTTGMPKIVVHTHYGYPMGHLTTTTWVGMKRGDLHYNISQPGWAKFSWSSFFAPWNVGATILGYHIDRFDPKEQLQTLQDLKVNTFCSPPTSLRMLIQEDLSAYTFSLRECVAAGEPLNPEIIEVWKKGTGVLIRDGYGQTEATALVVNLPNSNVKFGSMGKPTFLYDIVIADDHGQQLENLEEGNICLTHNKENVNGLFKTYLNDTGRHQLVFKHGLYYTGDKAYKDEEGYLWFVGRDDDVIKASDFRIGPFEVESVLLEHPKVLEAAVIASPHALRSNAVKAFIILAPEVKLTAEVAQELFDFCENQLARYKIPRIIEFTHELPKTISGKIRRIELRAEEAVSKQKKEKRPNEFYHDKY